MKPRTLIVLCVAALAAAFPSSAGAQQRYAARPPVRIAPGLQSQWLLQLSPGSGVVEGYRRPQIAAPNAGLSGRGVVVGGARLPAPGSAVAAQGQVAGAPLSGQQTAAYQRQAPVYVDPRRGIDPEFLPREVAYGGDEAPGTIIIDTRDRFLYRVEKGGRARRYGVGVGKPGFAWRGTHTITRKAEWPGWTPPQEMIARERRRGRILPEHMDGGLANPLGARALYIGSTLYRIHGTNAPWTIGHAVSSGCIRMRNEDVIELYKSVPVGTKVVVL